MQFIKPDINIPFIKNAKTFLIASGAVVAVAWVLVFLYGLNYGIDFAGGTEVQVKFNKEAKAQQIREALDTMEGIASEVQSFGITEQNEYLIKLANISFVNETRRKAIYDGLSSAFEDKKFRRFHHATAGGDKIEFTLDSQVSEDEIKKIFQEADSPAQEITVTGSEGRYVYRCVLEGLRPHIVAALEGTFGQGSFEILRLDSVGPKVGAQLKQKGILSVVYALIGILIYIAFRFDIRFAPGAVVALAHDVSITLGIFSLLQVEFTIPIIAALLTIVGYSLNDTIVVYDRIRENLSKAKVKPLEDVVNESLNQTLSRTILTSLTTLVVIVALLIFGGGIIVDFAFALLIGVLVGTYSSVFIASPIMIYLYRYMERRTARA